VDEEEFGRLDRIFHDAYRMGLTSMSLASDAMTAIRSWPGSQSLLSMWFHKELVPAVDQNFCQLNKARVIRIMPRALQREQEKIIP
jgi:hypothetical protein